MRTLSRPMFNMGGPIKQGIMHGIREPHKHGGPTGTGLVGDQRYPRTGGREHHGFFIPPLLMALGLGGARVAGGAAVRTAGSAAARRLAREAATRAALSGGVKKGLTTVSGTGITAAAPTGFKGYLMRDPLVKSALWAKDALFNPTTAGWGKSALRFATAPSSLLTAGYFGGKHLLKDKPIDPVTGIMKPGGYPEGTIPGEGKGKVLSDSAKKAFANKQRNERVDKYLKLMGYDRSKKTAIADALIDASKIVGDRGTLDLKNITQELINPIIQATSKRLDKPDQIREAVGLMATKAEIEKDLSAETDALTKTLKTEQIEGLRRQAKEDTIGGDIRAYNTKHGKLPTGTNLAQLVRLRGGEVAGVPNTTEVKKWMKSQNKDEIDYLTELTTTTQIDPGIYVVNNRILILDENNKVKSYNY